MVSIKILSEASVEKNPQQLFIICASKNHISDNESKESVSASLGGSDDVIASSKINESELKTIMSKYQSAFPNALICAVFIPMINVENHNPQGSVDEIDSFIEVHQVSLIQSIRMLQKQYHIPQEATCLVGEGMIGGLVVSLCTLIQSVASRLICLNCDTLPRFNNEISLDHMLYLLYSGCECEFTRMHRYDTLNNLRALGADVTLDTIALDADPFVASIKWLQTCISLKMIKAVQSGLS